MRFGTTTAVQRSIAAACAVSRNGRNCCSMLGTPTKTPTAEEAVSEFGWLIDIARAEPAAIAKHGRAAVIMAAK